MQNIGKPPLAASGVKNSYKFGTYVTSTGIPSLDHMLDGLVCGSITALESDFHQTYSKLLINLFVAEGLLSGHNLFYGAVEDLEHLFSKLPDISNLTVESNTTSNMDLKIAWRYENSPNLENPTIPTSKKIGHQFDLAKPMDIKSRLEEKNVTTFHFAPNPSKSINMNLLGNDGSNPHVQPANDTDSILPPDSHYDPSLAVSEFYQTGGYYFAGTQIMNCLHPTDSIADVAFDPLEELVWCVSRMGQLSAFYSTSMERYITTTIPLMSTIYSPDSEIPFSEFKQVFPSPKSTEHHVCALANNGLHVYSKCGRSIGSSLDKLMVELECMAATGPTGATVGGGLWSGCGTNNFSRFFVGGLQSMLLELDANERWGEVINAIDVGITGSVVLRPFSSGLCAGNTGGKVLVIDPRSSQSIVRELDAHTGEISDITVGSHGHTLVTCGWSRLGNYNLRVDRLLKVYDLRFGRAQIPISSSVDPSFTRFIPGCSDRLLAASQAGAIQTIQWGKLSFSPDDLGQIWLGYDRLTALDISQNGNGLVFGTEGGQLQLYLRDMNIGQFNIDPAPTEFALPFAESLWFTNSLNGAAPPSYPLLLLEDPSNNVYGTNLFTVGKAAADAAGLQLLSASLHQPTLLNPESSRPSDFMDLVERRKAEAANEAVAVAYKPIDYDDYRFSLSSVPFAANPPSVYGSSQLDQSSISNYHSKSNNQMCSSDWPEDFRQPQTKAMLPVDPELLANVDRKNTVRRPSDWGAVWHPYPMVEQSGGNDPELLLGRVEDGNSRSTELIVSG